MYLLLAKIDRTGLARLLDKELNVFFETRRENGDLLKMTDQLLVKCKKNLKSIKGIFVVNDSGTFSGVRNAVTIGNILSFALKIPIAPISIKDIDDKKKLKIALGKKIGFAAPKYNKEPNITIRNS